MEQTRPATWSLLDQPSPFAQRAVLTYPTSMPNRYLQLPLASAKTGMTLSDAVLDTKGNILLPKGTVLTEAMLASLLRHQIDTLAVASGEVSAEEDSAERDARIARLNYLFRQPGGGASPTTRSEATETLQQTIMNFRSSDLS